MKQTFKHLFAALVACAMFVPVQAASLITLFDDGDEYSTEIPINLGYLDEAGTRSQVIYPASALSEMTDEVINALTFYAPNGIEASGGTIIVSLGETNMDTFNGYFTGLTQVATITMVPGVHELTITFDTPYLYHGGNLVLDTYVQEATPNYSFDIFKGVRPDNYSAKSVGGILRFIPKTTFDYGSTVDYAAKVLPHELAFNTIRAEREETLSVTIKNIGSNPFTPAFTLNGPFRVDMAPAELAPGQTVEFPVIFAPAEPGDFTGALTIDCGLAGTFNVNLSGSATVAANDLIVCDSTAQCGFLPLYGVEADIVNTYGQMIYPAGMLTDMVGSNLIGLTFFAKKIMIDGATVQLSLKEVDETQFYEDENNPPSYVTLYTDLTVVATTVPVKYGTEMEFVFDTPYEYHGGNLLVECRVIEPGYVAPSYDQTYFYGVRNDDVDSGVYTWPEYDADYSMFVPFLPKALFAYNSAAVEPEWEVGDVNHDTVVDIEDVTMLISYVLGTPLPGFYMTEADVNGVEPIDVEDVTALIGRVLGQH